MDSHITEVMNSMSPQGSLIGNASEVLSESVAQDENCTISRIHETGEEISHSPTTVFRGDDLFLSDNNLSAVEDPPTEDRIGDDWYMRVNLSEIILKSLQKSGKTPLDIFSELDSEKTGIVSCRQLKDCLRRHGVALTDNEFSIVFSRFQEDQNVYYIRFLRSWSELTLKPEPLSRKRSSIEGYQVPGYNDSKRLAFNEETQKRLKEAIWIHIVQLFGNSNAIFKELEDSHGVVFLSDLAEYFEAHGIPCTHNQLRLLLSPFRHWPDRITYEEFKLFVQSIRMKPDTCLVQAFPQTFGKSLHIPLSQLTPKSCRNAMPRVPSVTQNLNHLPLVQLMVDMDELPPSPKEEAVSI
ncbi:hypothetical protein WA538_000315 [Blastocystis sp. DL]